MHRNPFLPVPSYPTHHPPPPPSTGAAPPAGYWPQQPAAASSGAYNGQWTAPQPAMSAPQVGPTLPAQTAQTSALYANYGYGGGSQHWQQQQRQQQQQQQQPQQHMHQPYHPPQPQPAPPAVGYSPYQPQPVPPGAYPPAYPSASVLGPGPPPQSYPLPPTPQVPPQPYHPQVPTGPAGTGPRGPGPMSMGGNPLHHTPPQQMPPAKRARFDRPPNGGHGSMNMGMNMTMHGAPAFATPIATPMAGPSQPMRANMNMPMRGGPSAPGRGGPPGRGGSMRGAKGFTSNHGNNNGRNGGSGPGGGGNSGGGGMRGRGGSMINIGGSGGGGGQDGRSGPSRGGGPLRGQSSRRGFGGGRGGGSFGPSGPSFRGRGGHHGGRGPRGDGQSNAVSGGSNSGTGKKDGSGNERTFTDFKIIGFELREFGWSWGVLPAEPTEDALKDAESPAHEATKDEQDGDVENAAVPSDESTTTSPASIPVKAEAAETDESVSSTLAETASTTDAAAMHSPTMSISDIGAAPAPVPDPLPKPVSAPARLRIYFHTPASVADSRLSPGPSFPSDLLESRRGKRKNRADEGEEDDDDEVRARPPPPGEDHDRASVAPSVAPSVAETTSEGDWLMAAFGAGGEHDQEVDEGNAEELDPVVSNIEDDEVHAREIPPFEPTSLTEDSAAQVGAPDDVSKDVPLPDSVPEDHTADTNQPMEPAASPKESAAADEVAPPEEAVSTKIDDTAVDLTPTATEPTEVVDHPNVGDVEDVVVDIETHSQADTDDDVPPGFGSSAPITLPMEGSFASTVHDDEDAGSETGVVDMVTNGAPGSPDPVPSSAAELPAVHEEDVSTLSGTPETSTPLNSGNTSTTCGDISFASVSVSTRPETKVVSSSANRLSIAYADRSKRLIINAEVVQSLKVFRAENRVEVELSLSRTDTGELNGISVEQLVVNTKVYQPLDSDALEMSDANIPPLRKLETPITTTLVVHLDKDHPLSEPGWVKTGDVQAWIRGILGRMFWVTGDAADGWERRIEVTDPDPPPTITTVLDTWADTSAVGLLPERQRFVKTHMCEPDNVLEVLLRLVRGGGGGGSSMPLSTANIPVGPLLATFNDSGSQAAHQNPLSLAVLAIFRMSLDFAKRGPDPEKDSAEVRVQMGEIVRSLPTHLLNKSLDGMFREWKAEKKGIK